MCFIFIVIILVRFPYLCNMFLAVFVVLRLQIVTVINWCVQCVLIFAQFMFFA